MKHFKRILAMLVAALLLLGAMSALAEIEVELDAPQDIDSLDLGISPDALDLSGDLALVEEEPEAGTFASNADGETQTVIRRSITLEVGEQMKVHNHVRTYYSIIITDTSSDPNVARISSGGFITAVTAGKCTITVTATPRWRKDPPKVWIYDVTVVGGPVLSETEMTLQIGDDFQLNVSNLGKRSIRSWSSSDPEVATVKGGKVTAVGAGQCDISVEISNGGILKCRVTVEAAAGLSSNEVRLKLRKYTTVWLNDLLLRNITWSCSNPKVVSIVANGTTCIIVAWKKGECTVTAKLKDGTKYSCKVIVE